MPRNSDLKSTPGFAQLFEDDRILWDEEKLGKFLSKRVLELGPLEGAHTYMLQQLGAKEIISIESNKRAFLKCLIIKNILTGL